MDGVISVIVPVYNVERYLPQCLESILSQSYKQLEVILVDDGSRDSSGAICDDYAKRDDRIVVIHQKNGGAAAAKNTGLRAATGEYLSFVDSDDFLDPDVYAYMVDLLKTAEADVVQCSIRDVYQDMTQDQIVKPGRKIWDTQDYIEQYLYDWTCGLMTDKLYKRSLFEGIFFEEGNRIDDEYFTYQGMMNAVRIVSDDKVIYNYRRRKSSVMISPESQNRIAYDRVDFMAKRRKNVIARFPQLRRKYDRDFTYLLMDLVRRPYNTIDSIRLIQHSLREYLEEKGHTPISVMQWYDIFCLRFSKPEKLLQRCRKPTPEKFPGMLYD